MSQYTGNTTAVSPLSGVAAQADILGLVNHLMSQGEGGTRPANIQTGGIWTKDVGSDVYVPKFWDGSSDRALVPEDRTAIRFDVGGTANAITLTSDLDLASFPNGYRGYFIPAAANTGAVTFAIDGGSATAVKTVTGAALPSGYIRSGKLTEFWTDGTDIFVHRLPEYSTSGTGDLWRFENNLQICWATYSGANANTAIGNGYWSGGLSKNLPAAFVGNHVGWAENRSTATSWANGRVVNGSTQWGFGVFSFISRTGDDIYLGAIGEWY